MGNEIAVDRAAELARDRDTERFHGGGRSALQILMDAPTGEQADLLSDAVTTNTNEIWECISRMADMGPYPIAFNEAKEAERIGWMVIDWLKGYAEGQR